MGRRLPLHAGLQAALIALLAIFASPVYADSAKQHFNKGLKHYQKGDYRAAADSFAAAYKLAADDDTLFAWAQAERLAGDCLKAVELFTTLLTHKLPAENKAAVESNIEKCKTTTPPEPEPEPELQPQPQPEPQRQPEPQPEPQPQPQRKPQPEPQPQPPVRTESPRPWYMDPVGGVLVGAGVVGVGVGVAFLVSARSADQAKDDATNHFDFVRERDRAESSGRIGVIGLSAGVLLVGAGVAWYVFAAPDPRDGTLSLWLEDDSAGLALAGRF